VPSPRIGPTASSLPRSPTPRQLPSRADEAVIAWSEPPSVARLGVPLSRQGFRAPQVPKRPLRACASQPSRSADYVPRRPPFSATAPRGEVTC
jgi:hypothetical protein